VDKDTRKIKCTWFILVNRIFSAIKGNLNGINPEIRVQQLLETLHLWLTYTELKAGLPLFKSEPNLIRHAGKISMSKSGWTIFPSLNVTTIMESGLFSKDSFTAKADRPLGFISSNISVSAENLIETTQKINYTQPFATDTRRVSDKTMDASIMLSNTRLDGKLKVSSVIAQSYSRYIGIEVTIPSGSNIPSALFNYMRSLVSASSELPNLAGIMLDTGDLNNRKFTNTGHLANIFRSSTGRWEEKDIINIYKYDSNKVYHAVSNRFPLSKVSIPVGEMGLYLRYIKGCV
jgi:hypothetical protein